MSIFKISTYFLRYFKLFKNLNCKMNVRAKQFLSNIVHLLFAMNVQKILKDSTKTSNALLHFFIHLYNCYN